MNMDLTLLIRLKCGKCEEIRTCISVPKSLVDANDESAIIKYINEEYEVKSPEVCRNCRDGWLCREEQSEHTVVKISDGECAELRDKLRD